MNANSTQAQGTGTPRVDAKAQKIWHTISVDYYGRLVKESVTREYVPVDLARQLETELTAALSSHAELRQENERLKKIIANAPHEEDCRIRIKDYPPCNCWKAAALRP